MRVEMLIAGRCVLLKWVQIKKQSKNMSSSIDSRDKIVLQFPDCPEIGVSQTTCQPSKAKMFKIML